MDLVPASVGQINQSGNGVGKFTKSQDGIETRSGYYLKNKIFPPWVSLISAHSCFCCRMFV